MSFGRSAANGAGRTLALAGRYLLFFLYIYHNYYYCSVLTVPVTTATANRAARVDSGQRRCARGDRSFAFTTSPYRMKVSEY